MASIPVNKENRSTTEWEEKLQISKGDFKTSTFQRERLENVGGCVLFLRLRTGKPLSLSKMLKQTFLLFQSRKSVYLIASNGYALRYVNNVSVACVCVCV